MFAYPRSGRYDTNSIRGASLHAPAAHTRARGTSGRRDAICTASRAAPASPTPVLLVHLNLETQKCDGLGFFSWSQSLTLFLGGRCTPVFLCTPWLPTAPHQNNESASSFTNQVDGSEMGQRAEPGPVGNGVASAGFTGFGGGKRWLPSRMRPWNCQEPPHRT